jgi:hypothetical protein
MPSAPCSLPNSLSSDPPLQQVVTDTWEVGLRGKPEIPGFHNLSWNAGAFRDENHNDILFIAAPEIGTGYFQNFAKTLREGFDADLDGRIGPVTWGLDWTFLSATYQSVETLDGSANNTNSFACRDIRDWMAPSPFIPGIEFRSFRSRPGRLMQSGKPTRRLMFEMNEVIASSSYARGNENNAYRPMACIISDPAFHPATRLPTSAPTTISRGTCNWRPDRQPFQPRILHGGVALEHDTDGAGRLSVLAVPAYASGPYAGNAPSQSADVLLAGCAAPGLGRIEAEVLIACDASCARALMGFFHVAECVRMPGVVRRLQRSASKRSGFHRPLNPLSRSF